MIELTKFQKDSINKRFSENALRMMKKRYLLQDADDNQEMPADMLLRIAVALAKVEKDYGKDKESVKKIANDFFEIMSNKEYAPAGRTITNTGSSTSLIANCVVMPIHDSMESIFQTLRDSALLQQAGCGLGFDLSEMRPADFVTKRSRGKSSGPVSFLQIYDAAFSIIKQQGRHGANMSMMRVDHPDILDFIHCKEKEGVIRNFNISVTVTDEFMENLEKNPDENWYCTFKGKKYRPRKVLRHPNGSVYKSEEIDITVKELFNELIKGAWSNGEPGIAFIDTINRSNPLPDLGPIASSNPCGEQFLHPYDNCNLGSINLAAFIKNEEIDWERLKFVTRTAVRLMDNVIDSFNFPVSKVTELARKNRRIGLGIMGFADMLYRLGIRYDSLEGFEVAEKVMGFINEQAYKMSNELAGEKGRFPNYKMSIFAKENAVYSKAQRHGIGKEMRNAALTTVAPTGSISMMFDCSSGIEPNFALSYVKQDKDGSKYHYFNKYFQEALNLLELSEKEQELIKEEIINKGTIQGLKDLPREMKDIFVVSMDISGENHMKMQSAFQNNVDNSISKTINLPNSATKEEVAQSFISAWKLGCKSCTVYREGSRVVQILNLGTGEKLISPTELDTKGNHNMKPGFRMDKERTTPRPRPEVMSGRTYKMKTGYGNMYVTVNNDETETPFEIFATIGKTGGFFQEQSEAICRLISLALRSGVKVEKVIGQLKNIRGPMPVFTEKGTILSMADGIGKILEEHVKDINHVQKTIDKPEKQEALPSSQPIADLGFMPGCPDCDAQLIMAEGCVNCKSCGFTRCL